MHSLLERAVLPVVFLSNYLYFFRFVLVYGFRFFFCFATLFGDHQYFLICFCCSKIYLITSSLISLFPYPPPLPPPL